MPGPPGAYWPCHALRRQLQCNIASPATSVQAILVKGDNIETSFDEAVDVKIVNTAAMMARVLLRRSFSALPASFTTEIAAVGRMGGFGRGGTVEGNVADGFEGVRAAFESNFAVGEELGAQLCIYKDGAPVVDLSGKSTGAPDYTADHLQVLRDCCCWAPTD